MPFGIVHWTLNNYLEDDGEFIRRRWTRVPVYHFKPISKFFPRKDNGRVDLGFIFAVLR